MLRRWMTKLRVTATRWRLSHRERGAFAHGLCAGDFVGGFFARTLEAQLNVVESGIHQSREFCFIRGRPEVMRLT